MEIQKQVQDYYSIQVKNTQDLKTNACCNLNSYPKKYYQNIHEEIKNILRLWFSSSDVLKMSYFRFRLWNWFRCLYLSQMTGELGK